MALVACSDPAKSGAPAADAGNDSVLTPRRDAGVDDASIHDAAPDSHDGSAPTGAFALDDVSVLFPLPPASDDTLYKADDTAAFGPILPEALFDIAPVLTDPVPVGPDPTPDPMQKKKEYASLRVVGLRIDPCFPSLSLPSDQCHAQVRLVMQPASVVDSPTFNHQWVVFDQAVHVFYELPASELAGLAGDLLRLKTTHDAPTDGAPLGVHPLLDKEGLQGAFAQDLRAAIFAHIGETRISRMTIMALPQDSAEWRFRGWNVKNGAATPIDIAGAGVSAQSIHVTRDLASIDPPVASDDDYSAILALGPSRAPIAAGTRATAEAATFRIENPEKRDPEHVSCAACHLAGPARRQLETDTGVAAQASPDRFASSAFDLSVPASPAPEIAALRSFGYKFRDVVVNARVVNESAAVASFLNARHP